MKDPAVADWAKEREKRQRQADKKLRQAEKRWRTYSCREFECCKDTGTPSIAVEPENLNAVWLIEVCAHAVPPSAR